MAEGGAKLEVVKATRHDVLAGTDPAVYRTYVVTMDGRPPTYLDVLSGCRPQPPSVRAGSREAETTQNDRSPAKFPGHGHTPGLDGFGNELRDRCSHGPGSS